uniref:cDNA FLJ40572 fis, clone THYMU2006170 n=1 Tax=Homo sapiens TaxID=9606 RepID=Q7L8T7_HUMAN
MSGGHSSPEPPRPWPLDRGSLPSPPAFPPGIATRATRAWAAPAKMLPCARSACRARDSGLASGTRAEVGGGPASEEYARRLAGCCPRLARPSLPTCEMHRTGLHLFNESFLSSCCEPGLEQAWVLWMGAGP